jgi:hypothetical protein
MEYIKDIDYTRVHNLTIEEVKACPMFAHFTDAQAKEVTETLVLFTKIAFDCYKNSSKIDEKSNENE